MGKNTDVSNNEPGMQQWATDLRTTHWRENNATLQLLRLNPTLRYLVGYEMKAYRNMKELNLQPKNSRETFVNIQICIDNYHKKVANM